MKSLNFSKRNLQAHDVLSKAQMKNIVGGHDEEEDDNANPCIRFTGVCDPEGLKCCRGTCTEDPGTTSNHRCT